MSLIITTAGLLFRPLSPVSISAHLSPSTSILDLVPIQLRYLSVVIMTYPLSDTRHLMFHLVTWLQSALHWRELFLAAGVIHLVGVILYDLMASGNLQPWDPTTSVSFSVGDTSSGKEASVQLPPPKETDPLLRVDRALVGVGFDRWDSFVQG